jgi:hypothetical protein
MRQFAGSVRMAVGILSGLESQAARFLASRTVIGTPDSSFDLTSGGAYSETSACGLLRSCHLILLLFTR